VQVLADPDANPLNGNEVLLEAGVASGTTVAQVGYGTIDVPLDGAVIPAGNYRLLVQMTAADHSRFFYAPQSIQVGTSTQPFTLDVSMSTNSMVVLGVNGLAGQTAVLEMAVDGLPWLPVATNTLTSARWEWAEPIAEEFTLALFRAVLAGP
ncbi:MAG: hypothetical protein MUC91_11740, partial [Verrucomicrobia bacterium]|nr:hypothetical protein [Verrucomicrobiota bacterium]